MTLVLAAGTNASIGTLSSSTETPLRSHSATFLLTSMSKSQVTIEDSLSQPIDSSPNHSSWGLILGEGQEKRKAGGRPWCCVIGVVVEMNGECRKSAVYGDAGTDDSVTLPGTCMEASHEQGSAGVQSKCDQARDCHVDLPAIENGVLVSITSSHELLWRRGLELHYQAMTIFSPESLHMLDPRQWSENKPHWPTRLDTFDSNTF